MGPRDSVRRELTPMDLDRRDLAGLGIVLLTAAVSVVAYPSLPGRMAIHFDAASQPDSFVAKPLALAFSPLLAAGVVALFRILPSIDPLGENVANFQRYYDLVAVVTVGVVAYAHLVVVVWNLGYPFDVTQAVVPVLAVTYYVTGLVIENASRNWFVGIRTPWTLSDEEVWDETHRRSAVLFKLAGLLALLALVLPEYFLLFAIGPVLVASLVPILYSFVLYRRLHRG